MTTDKLTPTNRLIPTQQQVDIIETAKTGVNMLIPSLAGSSKTTSLIMLAEALHKQDKRGIYLAYNKAIADECKGKFVPSVECRTIHSIAYGQLSSKLKAKLKLPTLFYKQASEKYDFKAEFIGRYSNPTDTRLLGLGGVWLMIKKTVENFCKSNDKEINFYHVKGSKLDWMNVLDFNIENILEVILRCAKNYWKDIIDEKSNVPMTHDAYLKMLSLSNFKLEHDYIMVDEAQDMNPVMLEVLKKCSGQKILVGDSYQNIYAWNRTVNVFEGSLAEYILGKDYEERYLTKSFRFGNNVERIANLILHYRGFNKDLTGNGTNKGVTYSTNSHEFEPTAIICRSNSGVLEAIFDYKKEYPYKKFYTNADMKDIRDFISSLSALKKGERGNVKHRLLYAFQDMKEYREYVEENPYDPEISKMEKLLNKHGAKAILDVAFNCTTQQGSDILVTTAHKSKGLSLDNVVIYSDFQYGLELDPDTCKLDLECSEEELNLLYVACTRTVKDIDVSNIKDFLDFLENPEKVYEVNKQKSNDVNLEIGNISIENFEHYTGEDLQLSTVWSKKHELDAFEDWCSRGEEIEGEDFEPSLQMVEDWVNKGIGFLGVK